MNNKLLIHIAFTLVVLPVNSYANSSYFSLRSDEGFNRFSVSAGWLHTTSQGKPNAFLVNTAVNGGNYGIGEVSKDKVLDVAVRKSNPELYSALDELPDTVPSNLSGVATINSLSNWSNEGTGLKTADSDTLAVMFNYHFTDNVSIEFKGGIPPTVDIKGKGQIYAPLRAINQTALGNIDLNKNIQITDLAQGQKASSVRAWLPVVELHYQFGKTGRDKFRPYVGAGLAYGYFNNLKLNSGIESDLIAAGHMIQNILDEKARGALDGKISSASPVVKVKTTDSFAPVFTLGATYDINQKWFAVSSVSYIPMKSKAKVYVTDKYTGNELIYAESKIDINPITTYLGIGYRF
ncbi:MAG: hypothetical protein GAK29_01545 [Acinetobacter bereziniae]|uniref:OmpW family protein n=1 Tax=Acinetobacter bereziniae TaxID=106648 RepID=A0A833URZ3_ACIBZ|nr:MAG: hypothetical protein GAK29_01545 [Acinetobacter bereziniae]